ncbi:endo-beta-1,4-glucanase [Cubamyces menziesii]|nr:endo-beta-1,4-glucanase [Cubamyces menziesii]
MILFATLLPFAAASVISRSVDRLPTQEDTSTIGLNDAAHYANKLYFGTATNYGEFNDTMYFHLLDDIHMFGQLTPAKAMKWAKTEPERGVFTFEQGDQIAALARQSGKYLRGHNCVWYNRLPAWVTNTTWTAPELAEVVQEHCYNIVRHWRGQIWDVINEPFNDDGTWRETLWYTTLGTKYISLALHAASKADPHAKLYINEYNITGTGPKATSMKKLIKDLKLAGVPIDGVGVQAHEVVGKVPNDIRKNLEEFVALGVEVAITELDVMFYTLPPDEAGLQQQRKDFETIVGACAAVERCVGVTVWDFTDKVSPGIATVFTSHYHRSTCLKYSWIPGTFPGSGDACPWDNNLQKKPAYYGIVNGFEKKR